jgi:serine/threonine protein phosphatase PrpC
MHTSREMPIAAAGASHVGRVREENEDSFFVRVIGPRHRGPFGIRAVLVVADGMGGHAGGRQASRATVSLMGELFAPGNRDAQGRLGDDVRSFIATAIHDADARVRQIGHDDLKAPGTTFTGAFVVDDRVFVGHVGDSRIYQIRNDEILPLSEDHSYVAHLVKEGKLTPEEARDFPQKNVLMRSLGAEGTLEVDEPHETRLMDGDVLLLCTDGLWDLVSEKEMVAVVQGHRSLKKALGKLIDLANARGGHDNVTAAAARLGRFARGRAPALARYDSDAPPVPGRWKRMVLRALLWGGVIVLSALLILITLFILGELSILKVPIPFDDIKRMIAP